MAVFIVYELCVRRVTLMLTANGVAAACSPL